MLGVFPVGIVSWAETTGSSALKRAEETEDCSTGSVCTRKLITRREAQDGWLVSGLMLITGTTLLYCSSSKSSSVSSTWESSSPGNTGSSSGSGSTLSSCELV